MYRGQRCREPVPGIAKINKASVAYADTVLDAFLARCTSSQRPRPSLTVRLMGPPIPEKAAARGDSGKCVA
ncbi:MULTISPECIES: hypothetical protein [Stutzerimonas stutzeri group]|uniref:hypothetical protein n=1 Tax=Stutzerimonas stutzeri group TaxID=136846 RepID=UPI0011D213A2